MYAAGDAFTLRVHGRKTRRRAWAICKNEYGSPDPCAHGGSAWSDGWPAESWCPRVMPPSQDASPVGRSQGRILVVDDEEPLTRAIGRALTAAGYEVSTAIDGMRAVDLLARTEFDAILSDIDMPG